MTSLQKKKEMRICVNCDNYKTIINDLKQQILDLQVKLESRSNNSKRKSQVLELLKSHESISILEISSKLDISTKNVSSQLTYLRQDGYSICTNSNGRKFLS